MRKTILWALAAANAALAVTFVLRVMPANEARAQARRPSEYLMIPAEVSGGSVDVVYVVDTTNGVLGGMVYDDSRNSIDTMAPVDLGRVFNAAPGPNNLPTRKDRFK
ncbi:MAG TPA: hypothetical protein VK324_00670 [Tepidisphaeraceae bacterium]|nr:hypothetical protein [Tepidisphaeraceae bacterium]